MRTRERSLHLRFTEQEWNNLMKQCSRSGLKPQAYIHRLIKNKPIRELPPVEYFEMLKNLRQINHNMNQIAVVANTKGFVEKEADDMFRKKPEKRVVELNRAEVRLLVTALMNFRNKVMKAGKPTEDINELLLMVLK